MVLSIKHYTLILFKIKYGIQFKKFVKQFQIRRFKVYNFFPNSHKKYGFNEMIMIHILYFIIIFTEKVIKIAFNFKSKITHFLGERLCNISSKTNFFLLKIIAICFSKSEFYNKKINKINKKYCVLLVDFAFKFPLFNT